MLPSTLSVQKELNSPSPASAGSERSTPISGLTLTLLTTLAAGLRFFALARKPFWLDECFSVEVARLSWHDFAFLLWRREANMALYYLLLRGWLSFGSTPYFIRSLSVIFSLAAVPAIFWLGSELFDRRVGLIAAALLSVNAYHIRYAQEARSYSLFCLLAILSSGFLVATLRRDSRRSWIGYVVSSVLAVYAHLYALLLIGAQWLAVRRQGAAHILRRSWIWIAAVTLPLVIFAAKTGAGPLLPRSLGLRQASLRQWWHGFSSALCRSLRGRHGAGKVLAERGRRDVRKRQRCEWQRLECLAAAFSSDLAARSNRFDVDALVGASALSRTLLYLLSPAADPSGRCRPCQAASGVAFGRRPRRYAPAFGARDGGLLPGGFRSGARGLARRGELHS
jgi:hypothetical protein